MKRYRQAANIKVGVVGYGGAFNMGKHHLGEMQRAGMTPTAVVELDAARLAVAAEDFPGIETYSSLPALLKHSAVDLVTLITPHNTHAPLGLAALRAGCHVVCEKPMAITTAECDAMIAAAQKNKVVLSTYHNRHWDGVILNAVKHIRAGQIGDVVRIEAHMGGYGQPRDWWRTSKTISGGVNYDWGVHLLEYSLQLIDAEIAEVSGHSKWGFWAPQTAWKKDCNEDEAFLVVRFKSGQWLTLLNSTIDANPRPGWLDITGTKGSYVMNWEANELIQPRRGKIVRKNLKNPPSQGWKFYQNIADHLTGKAPLVITPQWARRPIHILDLANRSAQRGTALKAKYR